MRAGTVVGLLLSAWASRPISAALHIEVIHGEGANNRFGRLGQAIQLRVSDDAGKPVKGAVVFYSIVSYPIDDGPSLDFGGNARAAQGQTDESGLAVSPPARPAGGNGPVDVGVVAEKDGEVANAMVHQMNVGFISEAGRADTVQEDLDIARLPGPAASRGKLFIRLRVTDTEGKPVAGAKVDLFLPERKRGSFAAIEVESGSDGIAEFKMEPKAVRGVTELRARAVANGLTATRFVPVE